MSQSGPPPAYQGAAEAQSQGTWAQNHPNTSNPFSSTTWSKAPSPYGGSGVGMGSNGLGGVPGISGPEHPGHPPGMFDVAKGQAHGDGLGGFAWNAPAGGAPGAGGGGAEQYSSQTTLSPELQSAMNGMVAQLRGGAAGGGAADAAYNQATSRLDPQWAQRQSQMGSELAAQGLDPSSQAYQTAMSGFGRDRNDAYGSARNDSFKQGLASFGMNMQGLQGLYSFLQGPAFATGQGPNYLDAAGMLGNYQLGQANQANQATGGAAQGAGSAIGAGIGLAALLA